MRDTGSKDPTYFNMFILFVSCFPRWWNMHGTATDSTAGVTMSWNPLLRKDIPQISSVSPTQVSLCLCSPCPLAYCSHIFKLHMGVCMTAHTPYLVSAQTYSHTDSVFSCGQVYGIMPPAEYTSLWTAGLQI